ncbi:serine/threonine protein kinase [Aggregicoccus sp. 17bor-14]|uniref:protein kinase domain-containing protein n=1 Tax=Myxococcaceae TaxID=31 RepID=UPI00129CB6ED|nr:MULTISPECIES: protein kinase [Myxococcaceae]MBF5042862.1 serine/threonine protein kinase [Simulacricoccus sp. 17bor-14]MRI88629.1 serine/threonine protein kinase [Aggregicoccus sp. 17bor-14]
MSRPSSTALAQRLPGRVFGPFVLVRKLAEGGMAEVFLAKRVGTGGFEKAVVIKRLLRHLSALKDFVDMFHDEASLAARLAHPNIIHIEEPGFVDGYHFICMEYLAGEDLRSVLQQATLQEDDGLPLAVLLRVMVDAAHGLHHAHELGVVHRDVSPSNLFLTYQGQVKVLDFGIAKAESRLTQTNTGVVKGKYSYMAPEQARGGAVDRRADVFALGVSLYEALTGVRPFARDHELAVLNAVLSGQVVPPRQLRPELPAALEEIVLCAMAAEPEQRFATAAALAEALESFARGGTLLASTPQVAAYLRAAFGEEQVARRTRIPTVAMLLSGDGTSSEDTALELPGAGGAGRHGATAVLPTEPAAGSAAGAPEPEVPRAGAASTPAPAASPPHDAASVPWLPAAAEPPAELLARRGHAPAPAAGTAQRANATGDGAAAAAAPAARARAAVDPVAAAWAARGAGAAHASAPPASGSASSAGTHPSTRAPRDPSAPTPAYPLPAVGEPTASLAGPASGAAEAGGGDAAERALPVTRSSAHPAALAAAQGARSGDRPREPGSTAASSASPAPRRWSALLLGALVGGVLVAAGAALTVSRLEAPRSATPRAAPAPQAAAPEASGTVAAPPAAAQVAASETSGPAAAAPAPEAPAPATAQEATAPALAPARPARARPVVLDETVIRRVVSRGQARIMACFEAHKADLSEDSGEVRVQFDVLGSGRVEARTLGPLADTAVGRCLEEQVRHLRFPAHRDEKVTAVQPFAYRVTR